MKFEVNITAYENVGMVNNLIYQFREIDLDYFIRVWDNSKEPLKIEGASEVRHNRFNPSLSRVWNWAIGQSRTEWVFISNDDIDLNKKWHSDLLKDIKGYPGALWHGPSRCFLFNKKLVNLVGWFDERMLGFTYEDLDYLRRMNYLSIPHRYDVSSLNSNARSLKHKVLRTNHSVNNLDFFKLKYENHNQLITKDKPLILTPDFYPLRPECLQV